MKSACYETFLIAIVALILFDTALAQTDPAEAAEDRDPEPTLQLTVAGLSEVQEQNLRAFMVLDDEPCSAPAWRLRARLKELGGLVVHALEPLGYFAPRLLSRNLERIDECWQLGIEIDPGPVTLIREVDIRLTGQGADSPLFVDAIDNLQALKDQPLRSDVYAASRDRLIVIAAANGYFDARFVSRQLDVYPEQQRAGLRIEFDTGIQYLVGEVQWIQSEQILDPAFVDRMVRLGSTQIATTRLLSQIQSDLRGTAYFDSVRVEYDDTQVADGRIPMVIHLDPGTRYKYAGGVGYSTDTGPRVRASYEHYRVNPWGHQFTTKALASAIESELTASYRLPAADRPLQRWYSFDAGVQQEDSDSVDNQTARIGYSQHRKLGSGWTTTFYIDGLYERFTFDDERRSSTLLLPGTLWQRTVSPGLVYPLAGNKVLLEAKAASETLLSDVDLFQIRASGKQIWGWESTQQRLIVRTDLGAMYTSNFDDVPASLRFFAGGDSSVRGYDYKQLGARDSEGEVIGGEYLFTGSIEWDHRFSDQWGIAVFTDFGDAFSDSLDLSTSVGLGARWYSPVGPVRVDLAHPFDDPDNSFRLHVSIGSDL